MVKSKMLDSKVKQEGEPSEDRKQEESVMGASPPKPPACPSALLSSGTACTPPLP